MRSRRYSLTARRALFRLATEGALTLKQLAGEDLASLTGSAMRRALARLVRDHWICVYGRKPGERLYTIHPRVYAAAAQMAPFLDPDK
ncbi:MAG: hypothetical protein DCC64_01930 [Planctomycetota bacterium]|nr:MAG: hypothetical protein DCC64_01930 [Planctomycetota bacterium]